MNKRRFTEDGFYLSSWKSIKIGRYFGKIEISSIEDAENFIQDLKKIKPRKIYGLIIPKGFKVDENLKNELNIHKI